MKTRRARTHREEAMGASETNSRLTFLRRRGGIYLFVLLLAVVGCFVSGDFLTAGNLLNVLKAVALLGIVACGMAFVTYSGHLADLSVPSIIAFSGITTVAALPLGLAPALAVGILSGLAIGALNGLVVGAFNANPILWTLAVAFFMEGLMRFVWSNDQLYPDTEPGTPGAAFVHIYRTDLGPVPLIVIVMLLLFALAHFVLKRTRLGVETRLVGASKPAARSSGVNVKKVVFLDFLWASFAASVAGIFITSMNKLGVFYLGEGYEFKSVTAVVIGGVTLSGGEGHVPGVFGGVLVIGLLSNVMNFMGVGAFHQKIVTGAVFILVVGIHRYQKRRKVAENA